MEKTIQRTPKLQRGSLETNAPMDLSSYQTFMKHQWVSLLTEKYRRDATLANFGMIRVITDLESINESYTKENGRGAFTAIDGRVKSKESFFKKLYGLCQADSKIHGLTLDTLNTNYSKIKDLCGVRFACPYFDEVLRSVNELVKPALSSHGYATDLASDGLPDKDHLDKGDDFGYRSYHFFVKIPTTIDIYGNNEMCLCEVQARTELQHIWAVKSHNLLYKPEVGWNMSDEHVVQDMREVSNSLRAADQFLISIRDRSRKKKTR